MKFINELQIEVFRLSIILDSYVRYDAFGEFSEKSDKHMTLI